MWLECGLVGDWTGYNICLLQYLAMSTYNRVESSIGAKIPKCMGFAVTSS